MVNARVRDLEFDMVEREGRPSRWTTLRALRVLRWAGRSTLASPLFAAITLDFLDGPRD